MADDPKGSSQEGCWTAFAAVALGLLVWTLIASFWQGGWSKVGSFVWLYLKVAGMVWLLVAVTSPFRQGAVEGFAQVSALLAAAWVIYARTFSSWRNFTTDLVAAVVAWLATIWIMRRLTRRIDAQAPSWRKAAPKALANLDALIWAVLAWSLVSILSVWRSSPLPTDPGRFDRIGPARSIVPESARRWADLRIGLALSGGGYRAAVFHTGVLQALETLGIRVSNLSTVSGGSLIGSFYSVGGDPRDFAKAIADGRLDLKRELMLAHNALRLVVPAEVPGVGVRLLPFGDFNRLDVQRALIDRVLLSGSPLDGGLGKAEPQVGAPRLMIAVTDLTYGAQIGLLPDGFLRLGTERNEVYRGATYKEWKQLTLANRVAISGAFPVAFPPRIWKIDDIHPVGATGVGERQMLLADGGLRDNTGVHLLQVAESEADPAAKEYGVQDSKMPAEWKLDAILSSDGGAVFGVFEQPGGAFSLLPRVFELGAIQTERKAPPPDPCEQLSYFPTRISASLQNIDPDRQFRLHPGDTPKAGLDRPWTTSFSPERYPDAVLDRIIDLLPTNEKASVKAAATAFARIAGPDRARDPRWYREMKEASELGRCGGERKTTAIKPPALPRPGVCEALLVRQSVLKMVYANLDVFQRTATLDDRPSRDAVESLEHLGKLLAYLQWPILESNLNTAVACKARPARPVSEEQMPLPPPNPRRRPQAM